MVRTSPSRGGPGPPSSPAIVAHLTCEADGSTTLAEPQVAAEPDGVHVIVRNQLEEPASLNGLGMDVDPGHSVWALTIAPGEYEIACWPFGDHGTGVEPPTTPFRVLDPDGLYVSGELECDAAWSAIFDFVSGAEGTAPDPISAAKEALAGVLPDDTFIRPGYPEQVDPPGVVLVRDGAAITSVSVFQGSNGLWLVGGASGCDGYGVDLAS